jgi:signal transduction histidine kinase
MFLHVFLAFPTGRLPGRVERVLVVSCYATVIGLQLAKVLLGVAPDNVLTVTVSPAADVVERLELTLVSVLLLCGALVLVLRRPTYRPRRPAIALLVDAFGLSLVMLSVLYAAGTWSWPHFEAIRNVTFAALGLAPVVFLAGLLDARLARSDVGEVLVRLRLDPDQELGALLARVLRDPSLTVAYWLPGFDRWVDRDGTRVVLPDGDDRATRIVRNGEEPVAALVFDRSLDDERELLDAVVAAAGLALENGRLQADLRARSRELQGSRVALLEAGQKERQRLERNLHDGAQQRLVMLSLELGLISADPATDRETRARIELARSELAASLQELREVARGTHPAVLTGHGLPVALESLTARAPVPVALDLDVAGRLPEPVEVTAYYVVSEALANIGKHAEASCAEVRVAEGTDRLVVEVHDDGVGGAEPADGSGLVGLRDRVEALGGTLRLSSPTGEGTLLRAEIPCR